MYNLNDMNMKNTLAFVFMFLCLTLNAQVSVSEQADCNKFAIVQVLLISMIMDLIGLLQDW